MATRKVGIFFSQDGKEFEVESGARTWGELRDQLSNYDLGNKKVVERETRVIYEIDEAVLPEGDFIIYVYPRKSKAGAAVPAQFKKITPDKIHTFPVDTIRKFVAYLNKTYGAGLSAKGTKEAVNKEVRKWMLKNNWPEAVASASPAKPSKSSKKLEKELKDKISGSGKASAPSAYTNNESSGEDSSRSTAKSDKKRVGPATLDIIDDKLDIIIELLGERSRRTAVPKADSKEDLRRDAERIKSQLSGVQS